MGNTGCIFAHVALWSGKIDCCQNIKVWNIKILNKINGYLSIQVFHFWVKISKGKYVYSY
jgi:hypothetical protein